MRTITHAMLALGCISAVAASTPNSANAQSADLYIRGPGVGVEVEIGNNPYRYRHWNRDYRGYNAYGYYYGYDSQPNWRRNYYSNPYPYSNYGEPDRRHDPVR